ncbi:MAG: CRISPR-associated protein Cas4 [Lachnospiraceae bacterium]|nr:CRISPR-associated protein Cas4 [Lachnospiraceae bacterium]
MNVYQEEEFLQLSGIQHFAFCRRQWALAYIELQWTENVRTVEGHLMHERVHDETIVEKRGDLIVSRAMPVHSRELGISGECDVVEFHKSKVGIPLFGYEGLYTVVPIEYKKGKPKENEMDILQLAAQSMCLEEMLCCEIPIGYLYYGETRHRIQVAISKELKEKVRNLFEEMHRYFNKGYTPKAKRTKSCNACSLKDLCLPMLEKTKSVQAYIAQAMEE